MKIEAIIKEKSPEAAAASSTSATLASAASAGPVDNAPPIALQALLDMGFTREAAAEALTYHANNVEQAADYLLASGMKLLSPVEFKNDETESSTRISC